MQLIHEPFLHLLVGLFDGFLAILDRVAFFFFLAKYRLNLRNHVSHHDVPAVLLSFELLQLA